VIAGPHTKRDFMTKDAGVLDVAPTLLYIMGLPVGEDFDGKVLLDALDPAYVHDHPLKKIRSYGSRKTKPPASSIVDKEYFERLRALGYVE